MSDTPITDQEAAAKPRAVMSVRAFLTSRPTEVTTGPDLNAERGLRLSARDTSGLLGTFFSAQWLGPEAVQFLEEHQIELKPGRCVDLELYNLRPFGPDLRARIQSCQLAPLPPSWEKHEEKLKSSTSESHA